MFAAAEQAYLQEIQRFRDDWRTASLHARLLHATRGAEDLVAIGPDSIVVVGFGSKAVGELSRVVMRDLSHLSRRLALRDATFVWVDLEASPENLALATQQDVGAALPAVLVVAYGYMPILKLARRNHDAATLQPPTPNHAALLCTAQLRSALCSCWH